MISRRCFSRSRGCTAPDGHLEPRKYCRQCHPVGRVPLPGEDWSATCDGTAPGRRASRSGRAPWLQHVNIQWSCISSNGNKHILINIHNTNDLVHSPNLSQWLSFRFQFCLVTASIENKIWVYKICVYMEILQCLLTFLKLGFVKQFNDYSLGLYVAETPLLVRNR